MAWDDELLLRLMDGGNLAFMGLLMEHLTLLSGTIGFASLGCTFLRLCIIWKLLVCGRHRPIRICLRA